MLRRSIHGNARLTNKIDGNLKVCLFVSFFHWSYIRFDFYSALGFLILITIITIELSVFYGLIVSFNNADNNIEKYVFQLFLLKCSIFQWFEKSDGRNGDQYAEWQLENDLDDPQVQLIKYLYEQRVWYVITKTVKAFMNSKLYFTLVGVSHFQDYF